MCDRKRPIFSEIEKTVLKELALKYSEIIKNKNTDSNSIKEKVKHGKKTISIYIYILIVLAILCKSLP